MQFADVVGQDHLKEQLRKSVLLDRVAHTQLFQGKRGCGDLLLALAYAKYVQCADRNEKEACGVCTSCVSMDKLEHPDVHFSFPIKSEKDKDESSYHIESWRKFILEDLYHDFQDWSDVHAPNKNLEIRVKEAASIAKKMALRSYLGAYKIVIIWNAENMNIPAANKLLKAIEEPPDSTLFLLVSSNPERLLPTIISRTQRHFVPPVAAEHVNAYVRQTYQLESPVAERIVARAEGDVREAKNLMADDSESMLPLFRSWMLGCYYNKASDTKTSCDDFQALGREGQKRFIRYGIQKIRQCVLFDQGCETLVHAVEEEKAFLQKFKKFVSIDTAEWFREEFERLGHELDRNANAKILFMDTSYQLFSRLRS